MSKHVENLEETKEEKLIKPVKTLDKTKERKFIKTRINFMKRQVIKLEKKVDKNDTIIENNDGKTINQNPDIKTLNDCIKNLKIYYDIYLKLSEGEVDEVTDDLSKFLFGKNK